jgi:membrane fusion protein, multidrug efflux system
MDTIDPAFRREAMTVAGGAACQNLGQDLGHSTGPAAVRMRLSERLRAGITDLRRPRWSDVQSFGTRWRRPLTALAILLAGIAGLVVLLATKPETPREAKAEREWSVDAVAVERGNHRPDIRLTGTVAPGRSLSLRALVPGTVVAVSPALKDGGKVRAGETLLQVEPLDYELQVAEVRAQLDEARARLDELRANVQVRQREAVRADELFRRGAIAAPRQEETQNAFVAEQARVRAQTAVIARLQAGLAKAETDLNRTRLVAPFDAFVGKATAETGMRLSSQEQIADLTAADGLEARVTLPTAAYGRLTDDGPGVIGRAATITWNLGGRQFSWPATVVRVNDRIDTATGGVDIFVRLQGSFLDQPLRAGAFVEVTVPDRLYSDVVRLPATALHNDDTVYVVDNGRLAQRKVTVLASKIDAVFIGDGLQPGEKVVSTRFQEIGPGLKVAIRGDKPAAEAKTADSKADAKADAKVEGGQ